MKKKIINNTIYNFNVVQRDKYHFAKNINSLSRKALGEILLIINDDIILDPKSIDNAIDHIKNQKNVGLIAGNLRYANGLIQHIGISFDKYNNPYHKFEKSIKSNSLVAFSSLISISFLKSSEITFTVDISACLNFSLIFVSL